MFLLILCVSVISGVAQIISSYYNLKDPDPLVTGLRRITPAGWTFYVCTILLMVMPSIQKAAQDDIDRKVSIEDGIAQDRRDSILRAGYDSSLLVMKSKFDTTTLLVTNTLGKYGYKLDSTNQILISIRDTVKTTIIEGDDPNLTLSTPPDGIGIEFVEQSPNGLSAFNIRVVSQDAGSAYFNIRSSFVIQDSEGLRFSPTDNKLFLEPTERLSKETATAKPYFVPLRPNSRLLFIWLRGTYKRLDGSGNFRIDDVYQYNVASGGNKNVTGPTRQRIIDLIKEKESH
jgi:hypothetical protein